MQTISPFLWFDDQAEQAAQRYVEIFPNSRIVSVARYGEGAPQPAGTAMSVSFVLDGVEVQALNGGPRSRSPRRSRSSSPSPTRPSATACGTP